MGDLVVLRQVRVEIGFSREYQLLCDGAAQGQAELHRLLHAPLVEHRLAARHPETGRAGLGIGDAARRIGAAAEQLGPGVGVGVDLQADHDVRGEWLHLRFSWLLTSSHIFLASSLVTRLFSSRYGRRRRIFCIAPAITSSTASRPCCSASTQRDAQSIRISPSSSLRFWRSCLAMAARTSSASPMISSTYPAIPRSAIQGSRRTLFLVSSMNS